MGYPGRQNIYEATIRRMVAQALQEQEQAFRQAHSQDTDEALLALVRQWAADHGDAPWPAELAGGSYLSERFGSWERLLRLAGLEAPAHPDRQQCFDRVREETGRQRVLYRRKKAEKKQLAQKRIAEQAAKRRARDNR